MKGPPVSSDTQLPKAPGAATYSPFQMSALGRRKTRGRRALFPRRFVLANRSQGPCSACPLSEGGTNQEGADAALFRELPLLSWSISSSFCKHLAGQSGREGKGPMAFGQRGPSHRLGIKSISQRAGGGGVCVWTCVHNGGTTPQPLKPEAKHQPGGLCPGQIISYTSGRSRAWGLEKDHPRAF